MELWQDSIIALLAAAGLASLLWGAIRALLFSRPRRPFRAMALIPARGNGDQLEGEIRSIALLSAQGGRITRVLIVDCGLTEEGQKLCRLLAREERWVIFCLREEIGRYLP